MQDQPLAGIAHYLTDFLPVGGFVAVDFAVFTGRLRFLRAAFQSFKSIDQQILAIGAQFASGHLMVSTAVDMHKLFQNIAIFFPTAHITLLPAYH